MGKLLDIAGEILFRYRFWADRTRLRRLQHRGLRIGRNVYVMDDVEFDYNYPYLIEIGDGCRISRGARILSHDATPFRDLGVTRLAPVRILEGSFIGERAIILPGVTLGPRAMVAAGSVVNRSFPEGVAVAGNPARVYGRYDQLLERAREKAASSAILSKRDLESGSVSVETILALLEVNEQVYLHGVPKADPFYLNADMKEIRARASHVFYEAFERSGPVTREDKTEKENEPEPTPH